MAGEKEGADAFISRWKGVTASELSTAQTFTLDLCDLLQVGKPHATVEQDYMFERPVVFRHGDGSTSAGRIDCYKRGHFVLESKKVKTGAHTKGFDDAMWRARAQGENYARALPANEGRPPFVIVASLTFWTACVSSGQIRWRLTPRARTPGSPARSRSNWQRWLVAWKRMGTRPTMLRLS